MKVYDLAIRIEEAADGGDYRYVATSPDLPGLVVAGDTPEEVLSLAPSVASALIASMKAEGDPLPESIRSLSSFPLVAHLAVARLCKRSTQRFSETTTWRVSPQVVAREREGWRAPVAYHNGLTGSRSICDGFPATATVAWPGFRQDRL